jgi:MFS family permease
MAGSEEKLPTHVFLCSLVAAMNSCNLGYDIGVVATVGPLLEKQTEFTLNDSQVGVFIGAMNVGAIIGALSSNIFADKFGRRGLNQFFSKS